ncbi:hypothetical protein RhiirA4_483037 [Rhizophagus irregularis]|uniref:Uncharacterized protein n=1 Tax=Rhizophagus irregularis TaxID=588596 RepID=A0A2I1HM19_9GLOM|nr:hypothetical protein RhiirA4_483037 [Rhizophagus irregularis]
MRLEQDYYDSDKDNDELLPRLLALHSDHFHVKKYLQSNCQRVKKLLRTPSWTSLSSHFQKIISDIFPEKKDIQLIPSKGSTLPDISVDLTISLHSPPVDLLISSPSTSADLPIFSHSPLADLSTVILRMNLLDERDHYIFGTNTELSLQDVEYGTYSTFHDNNISPVEQMASPKVDSLDKFLDGSGGDFLEQYCANKPMVPPISKKIIIFSPPSPVITPPPTSFDKLTLAFTPDSDDKLSDSDDDSAFLPFDEDTLLFYESCLYDNYAPLPFIMIQ